MIRILIVSDVALYREGLAEALGRRRGIEVAGTCADPAATIEAAREPGGPGIVLLDMSAPGGVAAVRRLLAAVPDARVVAVTVPKRESDVIACAEAGVAGFLTCDASLDDLVAEIESVSRGETLCSSSMAAALLRRVATLAHDRDGGAAPARALTAREREILELIDRGLSNKQIAQALCIELPTVKNHVHHILDKLGVRRRTEAAALVREGAPALTRAEY